MEQAGQIILPPKKVSKVPPISNAKVPPLAPIEIRCSLSYLRPITVEPVPFEENALWNATMASYHPMSFQRPFAAHQRYWIHSRRDGTNQILGAMLFAAPAKALAARDAWIGWSVVERRRNIYRGL
jgi:hypothetical protein